MKVGHKSRHGRRPKPTRHGQHQNYKPGPAARKKRALRRKKRMDAELSGWE